jgi:hypothetical protein
LAEPFELLAVAAIDDCLGVQIESSHHGCRSGLGAGLERRGRSE